MAGLRMEKRGFKLPQWRVVLQPAPAHEFCGFEFRASLLERSITSLSKPFFEKSMMSKKMAKDEEDIDLRPKGFGNIHQTVVVFRENTLMIQEAGIFSAQENKMWYEIYEEGRGEEILYATYAHRPFPVCAASLNHLNLTRSSSICPCASPPHSPTRRHKATASMLSGPSSAFTRHTRGRTQRLLTRAERHSSRIEGLRCWLERRRSSL